MTPRREDENEPDAAGSPPPEGPARFVFRRRHRLTHAREFQAVFDGRIRKGRGPLFVHGLPSGLPHARLGLSIGRRAGNAVVRNRLKRLLREAFRLELGAGRLPPGYDLVVGVRKHDPLPLDDYRRLLAEAAASIDREWRRRTRRADAANEMEAATDPDQPQHPGETPRPEAAEER